MNVVQIQEPIQEQLPTFDDFWLLWPEERRVGKKETRGVWDRIPREKYMEILLALADWRQVWYQKGEWEFVKHPMRWLRDERWEDALPADFKRTQRVRADNQAFKEKMDKATAERVPMPAHLRSMLDELKRKGR